MEHAGGRTGGRAIAHLKRGATIALSTVSLCLALPACAATVKKDINTALQTLDDEPAKTHTDHLRERLRVAFGEWTQAAVQGAMQGWSNPTVQDDFRRQTSRLAAEAVEGAVTGALAGATNPARADELKQRLHLLVEGVLDDVAHSITVRFTPALSGAAREAMRGFADSIRADLGPALGQMLRDELAPGLARGVRDHLGPALGDTIKNDLGPALGRVITDNLRPAVQQVVDDLGKTAGGAARELGQDAQNTLRKIAWSLGGVLVVVLAIAVVLWHRAKVHVQTVTLLTRAIKEHERAPGVQQVLESVRSAGRGTPPGDNLDRILAARPTLRAQSRPVLAPARTPEVAG
jgi:hypothetical protein